MLDQFWVFQGCISSRAVIGRAMELGRDPYMIHNRLGLELSNLLTFLPLSITVASEQTAANAAGECVNW